MILVEEINSILKILNLMFERYPYLDHYKNSISCGEDFRGAYRNQYSFMFTKNNYDTDSSNKYGCLYQNNAVENRDDITSDYVSVGGSNTSKKIIHFTKFTPDGFLSFIRSDESRRNDNNKCDYFRLFSPSFLKGISKYNCRINHHYSIGMSIDKKVKIRASNLNFNMIRSYIEDSSRNDVLKSILEFFYAGKHNCVLAYCTSDSMLRIRIQTVMSLIKENPEDIAVKTIRNLFLAFDKINQVFQSMNIRNLIDDEFHPIITSRIYSILGGDRAPYRFNEHFQRYLKIFTDSKDLDPTKLEPYKNACDSIKSIVQDCIKEEFDRLTQGSTFGVKNSTSYFHLLQEVLRGRIDREKKSVERAFTEGMHFGSKIEMLGWHPVKAPRFIDEDRSNDISSLWWMKEVKIIPAVFNYQNKKYSIAADKHPYKVTKLYINQEGTLYCEGNHPNVRGGKVCMGDLRNIRMSGTPADVNEFLQRCEQLLELINFDSAYHKDKLESMVKEGKLLEILSGGDSNSIDKKQVKPIRALNFNSDEIDVSSDEEKPKRTKKKTDDVTFHEVRNSEGIVLGVAQLVPDDPQSNRLDSDATSHHNRDSRNINYSRLDVNPPSAPVVEGGIIVELPQDYEINLDNQQRQDYFEWSTNRATLVQEDGNTIPYVMTTTTSTSATSAPSIGSSRVFYSGSSGADRLLPYVQFINTNENLSLDDSNLIPLT